MRELWQSYRWRRRFAWSGAAVAFLAGLVVVAILLPKDQGRRVDLEPTGTEAAQTVATVERVPVTRAQREAVNRTLVAFISTGVTRENPAAAWDLTTSAMRAGLTRKEWDSGAIPVVPYPAHVPEHPEWNVITSHRGDLLIDLLLQPRAGSSRGPIAFAVALKRTRDGRWLVDSMVPEQVFSPVGSKPNKPTPSATGTPEYPKGRLSPLWFAIPAGLLGLALLVPIMFALASWRRSRAIERRYRRERGL